jgi:uncharacterized lipoprotein YddW (UPF0748 family)
VQFAELASGRGGSELTAIRQVGTLPRSMIARKIAAGVCACVIAAGVAMSASHPPPPNTDIRGMWVLRTTLVSRESIAAMVRDAASGGFNTLLVQVRGRGEAFYRSDIEPRASDLDRQPAAFDPLATTLELAHAAGLRVHAWINVNLVASGTVLPRSPNHVVLRRPDWLMAPKALAGALRTTSPRSPAYVGTIARWTRAATNVEGLYLSPVTAASREYTVSVIRELTQRYALDGVHLDYIRFPAAEFDYSPTAIAEFRASLIARTPASDAARLDRAAAADPSAWTAAFPIQWAAFRRDRLTTLVTNIREEVKRLRPEIPVSAAVVPSAIEARDERLQDWLGWSRAGLLDAVCPMIYTTDAAEFATLATELDTSLDGVPYWAGIGAYRLPIASTIDRVKVARRHGASGVLLFSYDQLTDAGTTTAGFAALRPVLLEATASSGGLR